MTRDLLSDLRLACRTLWKDRGFTAPAIATLGLGMTLFAVVLVVVNAYLVRGFPYPEAQRLYSVRYGAPGTNPPRNLEALDWTAVDRVVEHAIAWDLDVFYLLGGDHAESAPGAWVTPGFMKGFGFAPAIGRAFDADAFTPGNPQVALISHRLWQTRFAGDPQIVGRRFAAYVSDRPDEAESFTIVGVLPREFWHMNPYTEILAPLRAPAYPYMVRLRDGVAPSAAAAQLTTLVRAGTSQLADDWQVDLVAAHDQYVATVRPMLRAVTGAAGLVLLIAWANVGGLLLIRTARRRHEIAVRMALGARRSSIARLLILEGVVLAAGATAVGLIATGPLMPWLGPFVQRQLGRTPPGGAAGFTLDSHVIAAAAIAGALTALACGLAPLAATWRFPLRELRASGRSMTGGRGTQRARSTLIAIEVGASLALLAGCLLMVQSVIKTVAVDLGIRADRVLSVALTLRQRSYPDALNRVAFFDRAVERLRGIPGVEAVGLASSWPLQAPRPEPIETEGSDGPVRARSSIVAVTPDYFATLGVPFVAGQSFASSERLGGEPVAIVSQTLARRLWADRLPIGARVIVPDRESREAPPVARRVVGVVSDVRQSAADDDLADLYVPMLQSPGRFAWTYVRTSGTPDAWLPALRSAFHDIDPEISVSTARPLRMDVDQQSARPKFLAWLLAGFAVVAAVLALIGVYGVIAYAVRQREREIAVRMALGADARTIARLFLRQGGVMLLAGLVLGLAGAVGAGRALESQLFGVRPADPLTLILTLATFGVAGLAAVWWPARRASGTNPAAALQEE